MSQTNPNAVPCWRQNPRLQAKRNESCLPPITTMFAVIILAEMDHSPLKKYVESCRKTTFVWSVARLYNQALRVNRQIVQILYETAFITHLVTITAWFAPTWNRLQHNNLYPTLRLDLVDQGSDMCRRKDSTKMMMNESSYILKKVSMKPYPILTCKDMFLHNQ